MSLTAAVVRELIAAGVTGDALVTACERIEAAGKSRSKAAERTARWRERKANRHGDVTCDGAGQGVERHSDVTASHPSPPVSPPFPLHPLSPPISPPSRAGLGSARDLETELRKAAGWQSEPAPKLAITGEIQALLDAGADLEVDVLPTVRALAPSAGSRTSWRYFVRAIAEARDRRLAAATVISMPTPMSRNNHGPYRQKPSRDETFDAIDRRIDQLREAEQRAARSG